MANNERENVAYTEDGALLKELETYYSYVLDQASLNTADPITANIKCFNIDNKVFCDGPKLGKTVVYMTRPNMNFRSRLNITRCRAFNYLMTSQFGAMLARYLMYSNLAGKVCYGTPSLGDAGTFSFKKLGTIIGSTDDTCIGGYVGGTKGRDSTGAYLGINESSFSDTYKLYQTNFIPLITNTCTETSSAKDMVLEVNETEGDFSGDKLQYAAGIDESLGPGEITLSFDDLYGSPVMNLMILWVYYMHYVAKGLCIPEKEYIINRIIDYTCSIYVFMLDTDQETIVRWTKYCGCFPKSIPFGQIMHTREINLQALSQIQIPFAYNFACPMDTIDLVEFNMLNEPAILERVAPDGKRLKDYTTPLFKNHSITIDDALYLLGNYPADMDPVANLPKKLLEPDYGLSRSSGYSDSYPAALYGSQKGVASSEFRTMNPKYKNRIGGLTKNNFAGHPYIVDGNRLMYL